MGNYNKQQRFLFLANPEESFKAYFRNRKKEFFMNIRKLLLSLGFGCIAAQAQVLTCSNGTSQQMRTVNNYDYELWSQDGAGSASLTITANTNPENGGTFEAEWSGTVNVLSRAGKKFKNNETVSSVGTISIDFEATWSSSDNVKMLGIYGWGYFAEGTQPTDFSDQIEYYIIQDRGSYNSATQGTNCTKKGSATIDGIEYNFTECDRIGQPMLTGNGNFKQYFSYPAKTSSHRTSGHVSVSTHFSEWAKAGMPMNKLYEVAMKVESYTGNTGTAKGSAKVTKNILCIGNSCETDISSSSTASSSSSALSANPTCDDYDPAFCGGLAFESVSGNSDDIPSSGECLYIGDFETIQPTLNSTVIINGESNTCGSEWDSCNYNTKPEKKDGGYYVYVADGDINAYENNGWVDIVARPKPLCNSQDPSTVNRNLSNPKAFSIRLSADRDLLVHSTRATVLEIFDMLGNRVSEIQLQTGEQSIHLTIPSGHYLGKVRGERPQSLILR